MSTHDQTEAMMMSDRIAVMNMGVLVQLASASEIYNAPKTMFVADFVGRINFLPVRLRGEDDGYAAAEFSGSKLRVPKDALDHGNENDLGDSAPASSVCR